ncbi:hypothetical protein phiOC_p386 [Ochrobactrum phage vB_OspM_OC]|nr:hypothetical protein phiOC_p386 [Ochrobactrum phage vB_OspM_OC]
MTKRGKDTIFVFLMIAIFIATLSAIVYVPYRISYGSMQNLANIEITGKERIVTKEDSKYLVFTKDEVFENTDTIFHAKFNSSDLYGRINAGDICRMTVNGYRVPFLSMYRNILKVECISK